MAAGRGARARWRRSPPRCQFRRRVRLDRLRFHDGGRSARATPPAARTRRRRDSRPWTRGSAAAQSRSRSGRDRRPRPEQPRRASSSASSPSPHATTNACVPGRGGSRSSQRTSPGRGVECTPSGSRCQSWLKALRRDCGSRPSSARSEPPGPELPEIVRAGRPVTPKSKKGRYPMTVRTPVPARRCRPGRGAGRTWRMRLEDLRRNSMVPGRGAGRAARRAAGARRRARARRAGARVRVRLAAHAARTAQAAPRRAPERTARSRSSAARPALRDGRDGRAKRGPRRPQRQGRRDRVGAPGLARPAEPPMIFRQLTHDDLGCASLPDRRRGRRRRRRRRPEARHRRVPARSPATWACASSTSSRPTTTPTTSPVTAGSSPPPARRIHIHRDADARLRARAVRRRLGARARRA